MGRLLILTVISLAVLGCRGERPSPGTPASPSRGEAAGPAGASSQELEQLPAPRREGEKIVVKLETNKGAIELELDPAAAPKTVAHFVKLVKEGFYDGMPFHRVEPGFVIQAGDPALVGRPPVGYTIPDERSPIRHTRGVIAMARLYRGGAMVPNSASTQFYITLGEAPHLDQAGFTAFGRVTKGMEVADHISVGDRIIRAAVPPEPASSRPPGAS